MLEIWNDRIIRMGILDTYSLRNSLKAVRFKMDKDAMEVEFGQRFKSYGVYQDAGTGKETPIGNPGDIGRHKVRERRPWFNPSFYSSYRNILEAFAESIGLQSMNIITNALKEENLRKSIR